jgi:hypothetical protein
MNNMNCNLFNLRRIKDRYRQPLHLDRSARRELASQLYFHTKGFYMFANSFERWRSAFMIIRYQNDWSVL